ncbi:MAG: RNA polymerase factor sigma-54 [Verrucomicrobiota bacterium]|nr:RNA polymerase factor sigma-54 [Verrucomicrobiota bacterium]
MKLNLQPQTQFHLAQALQRALQLLQLPQIELSTFLREEIEKNPLLEFESEGLSSLPSPRPVPEIAASLSLFDHLLSQIREALPQPFDQEIAQTFISHLDEKGFLAAPLEEIAALLQLPLMRIEPVLRVLQTFDPPGIFARSLQEAFLLQLERKKLNHSSAYQLVRDAFTDLLQGRYALLKKKLRDADLANAIEILSRLSTRPASTFAPAPVQPIYPDLRLIKIDHQWIVEPIEDSLPKFRLKTEYLELPNLAPLEKQTIRMFAASAKWLIRSMQRRRKLLLSLASFLVSKQTAFLNQKGPLLPITASQLSTRFQVHESTISRALSNKYLATPSGLLPLHSLIPSSSNESVKRILQFFIAQEDKHSPLTDDQLAEQISKEGHAIARRTIAKYRKQLKIGSASARKHLR